VRPGAFDPVVPAVLIADGANELLLLMHGG